MWLFPELMNLLRPIILERARPGTRVVTSTWGLGSWQPDVTTNDGTSIYMWIVPARIAGGWDWDLNVAGRRIRYASVVDQQFQKVEGAARAGDRREVLNDMILRGDDLTFVLNITLDGLGLTRHEFSGKVNGDQIVGTVKVTPPNQTTLTLPWRARKTTSTPDGRLQPGCCGSTSVTMCPRDLSAAATTAPDRNDTSRSALGPPNRTVMFRLLLIKLLIPGCHWQTATCTWCSGFGVNFPAENLHFRLQLNASFQKGPAPDLGDKIQNVSRRGSSVVYDKITVLG
jgi:hypothetical protein